MFRSEPPTCGAPRGGNSLTRPKLGVFAGLFLMLGGCNVFAPLVDDDLGDAGADAWIEEGQRKLQNRDFEGARSSFSQALALDSTRSLAWHGLAKSTAAVQGMDIVDLLVKFKELTETDNAGLGAGGTPFLSDTPAEKNRIYQPMLSLKRIYSEFVRRDTLGLTDRVIPARLVVTDLAVSVAVSTLMRLADFNGDGVFDERDNILSGVFDNLVGGDRAGTITPSSIRSSLLVTQVVETLTTVVVDPGTGLADTTRSTATRADTSGTPDPAQVTNFNNLVTNADSLLNNLSQVVDLLPGAPGTGAATDTATRSQIEIADQARQFLDQAGGTIVFYRLSDSLDNDGDGCADEEVLDSRDNDGDGIVDEDLRVGWREDNWPVGPGLRALVAPDDGILNTQVGPTAVRARAGIDDLTGGNLVYADEQGRLQAWVQLQWNASGMSAQVRDSIRLSILAIADPAIRIARGQAEVGGCWRTLP